MGSAFTVSASNYLQTRSAGAGDHRLTVTVDGGANVPPAFGVTVDVSGNTGIERSDLGPYQVEGRLGVTPETLTTADPVAITYALTPTAEPAESVEIVVLDADTHAVVVDPQPIGTVAATTTGELHLGQLPAGPHRYTVLWKGEAPTARGSGTLQIDVVAAQTGRSGPGWWTVVGAAAMAFFLVARPVRPGRRHG